MTTNIEYISGYSHDFFFHPDYTVGFGFTPNLLSLLLCFKLAKGARGLIYLGLEGKFTAGRESHPALKIITAKNNPLKVKCQWHLLVT